MNVLSFGVSAGAMSVGLQMVTNGGNTESLFRAAFMDAGSPIPAGSYKHGQKWYDIIVQGTGCAGKPDTLACLRAVPIDDLMAVIRTTPNKASYEVDYF